MEYGERLRQVELSPRTIKALKILKHPEKLTEFTFEEIWKMFEEECELTFTKNPSEMPLLHTRHGDTTLCGMSADFCLYLLQIGGGDMFNICILVPNIFHPERLQQKYKKLLAAQISLYHGVSPLMYCTTHFTEQAKGACRELLVHVSGLERLVEKYRRDFQRIVKGEGK